MAINKNKVMEAAQKFVEKGQLDKAIKEYSKIVEEDSKDVRVWLKLGDLYAKKGSKQEATHTYLRVAQFYSDQGFYLKAVAVYKQVLKLDPRLVEVNLRLAEVYRQLGLHSDAMQQYELVAAFYHREGKPREALAAVRELVELDPENVSTRIKLAELYSKEQLVKEAVAEFAKAAEFLRANGRTDDFIKVAERLVWHQPDNHAINRELAGLYLKRSDPRHALQKLQACFKADPRDVETLALLASAFLALDQKQKTVSVWKELARVLAENQQGPQAVEVHRRILSLVPDDADALAAVGGRQAVGTGSTRALAPLAAPPPPSLGTQPVRVATPVGSEPGERVGAPRLSVAARSVAPMEAAPLVTLKSATRQVEPVHSGPAVPVSPVSARPAGVATPLGPPPERAERAPTRAPARAPAPSPTRAPTPAPPPSEDGVAIEVDEESDRTTRQTEATIEATIDADFEPPDARAGERDEQVAKLLGEADVYIKYGIRDRAVAHLGRILELDPDNLDAHERLKDVYQALGRKAEAARELGRLVELVAMTAPEQAGPYLAELATLDAAAAAALERRLAVHALASVDADDALAADGAAPVVVESVDVLIEPPSIEGLAVPGALDQGAEPLYTDLDALDGLDGGTEVRDEFTAVATAGDGTVELDPDDLSVEVTDDPASDLAGVPGVPGVPGVNDDDEADPGLAFDEMGSTAAGGDRTYDISMEAPSVDSLQARALEEADGGPSAPEREYAIDPLDGALEESIGVELDPADEGTRGGASLEDDLDEADFFVSQGLAEEARTILVELARRHPGHPLIEAKLKDLAVLDAAPPERPSVPVTAVPAGAPSRAAGPVAEGPRRVIARPLGETDADTHYDLGLAYKEMGLLEEAIKEFSLVRDTPGRTVQCHLMIGLCHVERAKLQEAVDEFKRGLYVDGITDREALALYFELGAAYEALGDEREALYYYEKVAKRDPRFREVSRRLDALQGRVSAGGNGTRRGDAARPGSDSSDEEMRSALDSLGDGDA